MVEGSGDELTLEPTATVARNRRPRALWGVLAALAVAGGALAVTSGGGSDDPPTLPVSLAGAGAGRSGAESAMSADMSMLAWITYVAGDDLPALGGEGPAYRVPGAVDERRVTELAAALGLDGTPERIDGPPESGRGGSWRLETDAGVLEVYEGAGASWWYSSAALMGGGSSGSATGCVAPDGSTAASEDACAEPVGDPAAECPAVLPDGGSCTGVQEGCAPAECLGDPADSPAGEVCETYQSPDGSTVEECTSSGPPPPTDLPSEGEARDIALELLAATGVDVDDAKVTVEGPYDAWYVLVEPLVDGLPVSGWASSVGVGSKGAVTSASGFLGTPERLGDYPLLDTRAVIDRLNEQQGAGFGGGPEPLIARDDVAVLEEGSVSGSAGAGSVGSGPTTTVVDGPSATTVPPCKVQPDGREICEDPGVSTLPAPVEECPEVTVEPGTDPNQSVSTSCVGYACPQPILPDDAATDAAAPCPPPLCPDVVAPADGDAATTTIVVDDCYVEPDYPEPEPVEVTLTDAERILVLLPASDGSADAYLLPGYRLSGEDGHVVDVPAVADESLAPQTPPATDTTLPPDRPTTCGDVAVEEDASGTTHTIQPCPGEIPPSQPDVVHLSEGETPEVGVPYYVDVDVECAAFELGGEVWRHTVGDLAGWSRPHEGGTFTLDAPDHGTFVGDTGATKTATFETGTEGTCQPTPR